MSTVAQPTPTHLPWKVRGTSIYFADVAGGFDVRNCPDPENLAAYIHLACNSFDALTEANANLLADAERYRRIRYCRKFVGMLETATMHCETDAEYDEAVDGMPAPKVTP